MIKRISYFVTVLLLTAFLTTRVFFFTPTILERISSYLLSPVLLISHAISDPIKTYLQKRQSYKELFLSHQKLQQNHEELRQENIKLRSLMRYAEKSKELREFAERYKLNNAILSKILLKTITPSEHTLVVNRGTRNGVKKDMVAIYKFQLLGRVKQAFPTYSKITLITDRHSKIAAHTNSSEAKGVVEGSNIVNTCKLRYISHLKSVQKGDLVLSSGQGLIFPEGFCLGEIINITTRDLCHDVSIKPLVNIKKIEMCHLTDQSRMNLF